MAKRPVLAIFRPKEKLADSIRLAEERGFEVVAVPMLETRAIEDPRFEEFLEMLEEGVVDAVVFTSSNGVTFAFHAAMGSMTRDEFRDALNRVPVVAIGPATRLVLARFGVAADMPEEYSSQGLVKHFEGKRIAARRVVLLRSRQGSQALSEGLASLDYDVMEVPVYEVGQPEVAAETRRFFDRVVQGGINVFAFLSSMTVTNFFDLAASLGVEDDVRTAISRATVAAIGGPTKETLEKEGIRVAVAPPKATFADLLDALESLAASRTTDRKISY